MYKFSLFLFGLLIAACGAPSDQFAYEIDPVTNEVQEVELGQAEQPFRGKKTPSFQYGTRTAATKQKCNRTSTTQTCAVPPSKTLTYCVHGQNAIPGQGATVFTNTDRARILAVIEGLDSISDFTLNPTQSSDCVNFPGQMNWFHGAVGTSGSAPTDVKEFANTSFGSLTSLTEGTGIVGNYQSWGSCTNTIDIVDITLKGTSTTQDNNGIDHAASHTLLACLGIGGQGGSAGRGSRNLFQPSTTATSVSTGEACQILGFTLSSPGQFNDSLTGECASD